MAIYNGGPLDRLPTWVLLPLVLLCGLVAYRLFTAPDNPEPSQAEQNRDFYRRVLE